MKFRGSPLLLLAVSAALACAPGADGTPDDSALAADSAAGVAAVADREACGDLATVGKNSVGTLVLGMNVSAAREACEMQDTTFTLGEGMMEQGLAAPLASGGAIVALTTGSDSVLRLMVTGSGPQTEQGIGVGSSIAQLREAYAGACVMAGEGKLVVIAPSSGVSFMTTSPVGSPNPQIEALPDTTTVMQLIVHGGEGVCP